MMPWLGVGCRCIFLVSEQNFLNSGLKFSANNEEDDNKKLWTWMVDMVIHPLWKKCLLLLSRNWFSSCKCRELQAVQCCQKRFCDGFVRHLLWLCRPYLLQMRWNELKYGFYRQNPAYFPGIYSVFLINTALPASNSVYWEKFMGKNFKHN